MTTNSIITIGRQYGSGGRAIGQQLSEELGIKFYDKELLAVAAKESGFGKEIFESFDEKPTKSLLYSIVMDTYAFGYSTSNFVDMPMNHKIFLAQFEAIQKIASEGPCIIVGRCADYALAEYKSCISVFIHADIDQRIKRISRLYEYTESKAKDLINKTDKKRASYYNYYSSRKWGELTNYNLTVDSGKVGISGTVELIKTYILAREQAVREGVTL